MQPAGIGWIKLILFIHKPERQLIHFQGIGNRIRFLHESCFLDVPVVPCNYNSIVNSIQLHIAIWQRSLKVDFNFPIVLHQPTSIIICTVRGIAFQCNHVVFEIVIADLHLQRPVPDKVKRKPRACMLFCKKKDQNRIFCELPILIR